DDLPLSKGAVASRLDRAEMHEDIFAGLRGDEAIALLGVEPLHGSNRHVPVPPSTVLEVSTNAVPTLAPGARGQARPAVARQNVHLYRAHTSGDGHCLSQPGVRARRPARRWLCMPVACVGATG